MNDANQDLRSRTKHFALTVIRFYAILPNHTAAQVLGKQVLRSATSVGAHYREACRARSAAEFISKMEGGLQELDETAYWLELLTESDIAPIHVVTPIQNETKELIAIFVASVKTAKSNR
ncbi:MAG TPA: four helix bundle protein [Tepidisphaeraceae bacterium]|jgi:four helix bundle protein|nr:four helix bundle protein [Tepidisphaeraceae bacterium]